MKKIGKILLVCILFLGMVSFVREDTVEAAVDDTFTANIKNVSANGTEQDIECVFKITKEATDSEKGEVSVGDGNDKAIENSIVGSISIPNEVVRNGKTYVVTQVAYMAFSGCDFLTNTGLASNTSIKRIGTSAYSFCISLTNTDLATNTSVKDIEQAVFAGCTSLVDTGLGTNTSVESIDKRAFVDCTSLENTGLSTNTSVQSLGDEIFEGCTSLTSTGLDDNTSVENIGEYAFYGCTSLTNTGLERNNSIKRIGKSAFEGCTSLTSTGLNTNTTVKEIGEYVFYECTSLESTGLETNNSIETLGEGTFLGCTSLSNTGLETNNTIKELGEVAFAQCTNLTTTGLEKNTTITDIGDYAFGLCTSLTTTGLSKNTSVESIGDEAFVGCTNLTAFYFVKDSIPTLGTDTFPSTTTLYYYSGMTADEVNKLREPRKAYEMIEVGVDSDSLRDDYIAGEEFTLEDVNFNVTYGDTALGEAVSFVNPVLYDDDINSFTFTSVTLVKGVNTIAGKYLGMDFSFEVNAIVPSYDVTVKNGTSPKTKYEEGETVTITANAPENGKTFKNWKVESGGVTLADANKKTTTFVMPKSAVVVEAQYETASVPPVVEEPEIIIGAGFTYQINKNRDMEVTCSGKLEDLMEVYVDGVILHKDHYTLRSGSTIITLKASYLNTLTVGKHTLKLQYKGDVSAETYFLIAGDGQEGTKTPSTGDKTMVGLWMMSMLCTGGYIVYRYKKRYREIEKS